MNFFGVGPAEAGLVFVIALIVVGPQRFPEIMRQAGRWYRVARAYSNEVMQDVRSAVDDIEREVKAETGDLRAIREFADIGKDLKAAQKDAEEIGREADGVLRDRPATPSVSPSVTKPLTADEAKRSIRPSQRSTPAVSTPGAGDAEGVPPIELVEQARETPEAEAAATPSTPSTHAPTTSNFDPFSKKPAKKGPLLIPREAAPTEADERTE